MPNPHEEYFIPWPPGPAEEAPFYLENGHEVHVITTIPENR